MNQKLRLVYLILIGLFFSALFSRNAALAWMTLPFLVYLGAGLLASPQKVSLSATRTVSHTRCEAGTSITMTVVIVNHGQAVSRLCVHECFDPKFRVLGRVEEPYSTLPAGGAAKFEYVFQAPRGRYRWKNIRVTVSDPFGVFDQPIELVAEAEVLVFPGQPPMQALKFCPLHTLRAPGINLSRLPGPGIDVFGIRAYQPGDPLRWIHWRLAARYPNRLFTKEFEREEMADIGLILDASATNNLKIGSEELFEHSIQAAAALTQSIIREGNRMSLLILGDQINRVFPGAGKHQLERMRNRFAACQTGENTSLNTLKYLPVKLFPSHTTIILISSLHEKDRPAIARLIASGYQVLVVTPDPVKFASRTFPHPLAVRIATVERAALLLRIRKMGAQVLIWPVENYLPPSPSCRFPGEMKMNRSPDRNWPCMVRSWFSSIFLLLLVGGAAGGVLSGLAPEMMIAGVALAIICWSLLEQNAQRYKADDSHSINDPKRAHLQRVLITVGTGLLLAEGGLQVHRPLPFGFVVLAVLLILFSLARFFRH